MEHHSADGGSATIRQGVSHPSAAGGQGGEGPEASHGEPIILAEPPLPLLACSQPPFRFESWPRLHGSSASCTAYNAPGTVQLALWASRAAERFPSKPLICEHKQLWELQAAGKLLQLRVR